MADEQMSFAKSANFDRYAKTTRRAKFLDEMDRILPWAQLCDVVRPHYPTGDGGRPAIDLERMLRIYFLQQWFNLSDPGVEEALYESVSMLRFARVDLGREGAPDETTVCKFRHLLEKHKLGEKLFTAVNTFLRKNGVKVSTGTIVDATIISAPSSTKNADKQRDPEMHQTKKGNQWYFGMKAHIGVDSRTRTIHTIAATAANVHDSKYSASSCAAESDECTATRPIAGNARCCALMRSTRATSPIAVPTVTLPCRMTSAKPTGASRRFARTSNMHSALSKAASAFRKCAIVESLRT